MSLLTGSSVAVPLLFGKSSTVGGTGVMLIVLLDVGSGRYGTVTKEVPLRLE